MNDFIYFYSGYPVSRMLCMGLDGCSLQFSLSNTDEMGVGYRAKSKLKMIRF